MNILRQTLRLVVILFLAVAAGSALAQITAQDREIYDQWLTTAERAERVIDAQRASNAALEKLRVEIADFRERFLSTRDQNSARIKTLSSQIDALGPEPEQGEEPADIAELRANLTAQLENLRVPRVVSEEAYNRANGLISEIDRIIRERQTRKLLSRGPSPLNPIYWPKAWSDLKNGIAGLVNETRAAWSADTTQKEMRKNLPAILVMVLVGSILLARSGHWAARFGDYLLGFGGRGREVWAFLVSLARIVLPLAGIIVLCQAASLTGLLGLRGSLVLQSVPIWGTVLLVFNWLGNQAYSRHPNAPAADTDVADKRTEAMFLVNLLAVALILQNSVRLFEQIENISEATRAVFGFVPIIVTSMVLLRLQRVSAQYSNAQDDSSSDKIRLASLDSFFQVVRRVVVVLGVVSPVLAAVGYAYAAEAIIYPAVVTLAVVAIVLNLQHFVEDVYAWIMQREDAARDSLFTVLAGFVLAMASLPFLAIVWGARVADLTELWSRFVKGFQVGDTRISPVDFLTFALIFAAGYFATRLIQGGLRNSLLPKTAIDPGGQNAIVSGTGYVGIFLAALLAVTGTGLDLSSLAIVAGALSVGIGFGLQTIVSNFVSGIILLIERPVSKGDWIEVGGLMGYVRDISVRATRIETFDRTDVIIPNSDLISGTVTNYTRGNTVGRVIVPVGVAYGTDTKRVEGILKEIANAHPMVLANPPPNVVFQAFGSDSLQFEIRAILRDVNWLLSVKSDMNHEIARRFGEENIEIPFPQRDVWLRNPEVLRNAGAEAQVAAPEPAPVPDKDKS